MKEKTTKVILSLLERGVSLYVTDRFAEFSFETERDIELKATNFLVIAKALGETLEEIEMPTYWERFLKRKDCPAYLKKLTTYKINAYYPKLSLPKERNWIAVDK